MRSFFGKIKIVVVLCHRPPDATNEFNTNLLLCFQKLYNAGYHNIMLLGDLNLPSVKWNSYTSNDPIYQSLCDIFVDFNLTQINDKPSRAANSNILDLVLVSNPESYSNVETSCSKHWSLYDKVLLFSELQRL